MLCRPWLLPLWLHKCHDHRDVVHFAPTLRKVVSPGNTLQQAGSSASLSRAVSLGKKPCSKQPRLAQGLVQCLAASGQQLSYHQQAARMSSLKNLGMDTLVLALLQAQHSTSGCLLDLSTKKPQSRSRNSALQWANAWSQSGHAG